MSIIERAVDKANGVETKPVEPPQTSATVAPAGNVIEAAQEKAAGNNSTLKSVETQAEPAAATVPHENDASNLDGGESAPTGLDKNRQDGNNFVQIDLERLQAAGFLTPDVGVNALSEEYQQIKRRVLGNMVQGMAPNANNPNLIMVTSSVPSEGKTFTSVNLSMSLAAEIDHTVLAIDTDIAKRDLTRAFGALGRPGIFDVLSDPNMELSEVMLRTNIPNFVLIPAGLSEGASTELLASARMRELCIELGQRYHDRIVIFDTPPVLATSAGLALGPQMGQVLLVVEAAKTKQETLREALGLLENVQITGLVLNKSKQQRRSAYEYYGYYYQAVD